MRTILNNLKCEKSRKKTIFPRFALTTTVIVLCMIVMSLTAYAYYFYKVQYRSDIINAATFKTDVSITENDTPVTVTKENENYIANLEKDKTYTVTLERLPESTAKTGFFVVTAKGCDEIYHTQQLVADDTQQLVADDTQQLVADDTQQLVADAVEGGANKVVFQIKVTLDTASDTTATVPVTFSPHWGTSSDYDEYKENGEGNKLYITNTNTGENAVEMKIKDVVNPIAQTNEQEENAKDEETSIEQTQTKADTESETQTEDLKDSDTPERETAE